jgi:hypothetical protein
LFCSRENNLKNNPIEITWVHHEIMPVQFWQFKHDNLKPIFNDELRSSSFDIQ